MSDARIIYLFERYIDRKSSFSEEQELWCYLSDPVNEKKFKILLEDALDRQEIESSLTNEQIQLALNKIHGIEQKRLIDVPQASVWRRKQFFKNGIAVMLIMVVLVFGTYFLTDLWKKGRDIVGILPTIENDGYVHNDQTILLLSDGRRVVLDEMKSGSTVKDIGGGTEIMKLNAEEISYRPLATATAIDRSARHRLEVPSGKQLRVHLMDASFVVLNACSTIDYQPSFSAEKREVLLSGEAFFEVAKKNGQRGRLAEAPFVVKSKGQEITVLGTEFNVYAYANEKEIKTTLVTGRLKVNQILLNPGEQASYKEGEMYVEKVNAHQVAAWRGGYFTLDREDIYSIMRKIARWYHVEISYQGALPPETFGGVVAKSERMEDVLDVLAEIAGIRFKVLPMGADQKGRRIVVMP